MKTVKVTTENKISIIDVDFDDFRDIQRALGGHFQSVHTQIMKEYFREPMLMLVDEDGFEKELAWNRLGCLFYGTALHFSPIVGDIIFCVPVGEDWTAPTDAETLKEKLMKDFDFLEEEIEGEHEDK